MAYRDSTGLIRAIVAALRNGVEVPTIAGQFHAGAIADACHRTRAAWGLETVALSGEIFQNALLVERTVERLETDWFRVLTHVRVPPNDGGISFGQATVAGARARWQSHGADGGARHRVRFRPDLGGSAHDRGHVSARGRGWGGRCCCRPSRCG